MLWALPGALRSRWTRLEIWWTVDGGGGKTSGDGYVLMGTIGQPDAGSALTSGGYTMIGGFWPGALTQYRIYLPVVLKNP